MPLFTSRKSRALLFVLPAAALIGCGPKGPPGGAGEGAGGMPPALVAIREVTPKVVPVEFEFPAQTAGSREVEVRSRVPGILLKRNYNEGSSVRAGQSLFTIDSAQFEAVGARTEADVVAAEARLANATRTAKRLKPLYEARAVSQKDFDDAVSAEEVANADVKAARARLAEARLNLDYTRVEAPVSGVTSRALKSEGTLIAGPQDLLTTVVQLDPIYVNFGLSEAEQSKIQRDVAQGKLVLPRENRFEVAIKREDGTLYSRTGRLAFTDVRVNSQTGTSDARAEIPNPASEIHPGQFVRVVLKGAQRPNAMTIPQRAVLEGPQGKMVYVLGAENKAEPRPIEVGEWVGDNEWVVLSGLKPGDKVIVEGLVKLFPGAPVQVGPPPQPAGPDAKK